MMYKFSYELIAMFHEEIVETSQIPEVEDRGIKVQFNANMLGEMLVEADEFVDAEFQFLESFDYTDWVVPAMAGREVVFARILHGVEVLANGEWMEIDLDDEANATEEFRLNTIECITGDVDGIAAAA